MITRFTMTGADDSVDPKDLLELSKRFPFVEWGILLSRSQVGAKRFPSRKWLIALNELYYSITFAKPNRDFMLSGHICGSWVSEIFLGNFTRFTAEMENLHKIFNRFQLNTHGEQQIVNGEEMLMGLHANLSPAEIIFQWDEKNGEITNFISSRGIIKCSALFDLSHGAGKLPKQWPEPMDFIPCGYAGGLHPDNLEEQIKLIEEKADYRDIWIDMETHVRSNDDKNFDLDKVEKCLLIAEPFIKK